MMKDLALTQVLMHKGMKSTRLRMALLVWLVGTAAVLWATMTWDQWIDLSKWIVAIYAGSEVGAKGAAAVASKNLSGEQ